MCRDDVRRVTAFRCDAVNALGREHVLAEEGVISPRDLDLINWVETAEEAWQVVEEFYAGSGPLGC